jgi:hypothetical protein
VKTEFAVIGLICLIFAAWLFVSRFPAQPFGAITIETVTGHEERDSADSIVNQTDITDIDAEGKQQNSRLWRAKRPKTQRLEHELPSNIFLRAQQLPT